MTDIDCLSGFHVRVPMVDNQLCRFELNFNKKFEVIMNIEIKPVIAPSNDKRVILLIEQLNAALNHITGHDGSKNADLADFSQESALFLLALRNGEAVACGGFRPLSSTTCELKRMFAMEKKSGLGLRILQELESAAKSYGYQRICLETRRINHVAVNFHLKNGYQVIENYGVYVGRSEAVCFGKMLGFY